MRVSKRDVKNPNWINLYRIIRLLLLVQEIRIAFENLFCFQILLNFSRMGFFSAEIHSLRSWLGLDFYLQPVDFFRQKSLLLNRPDIKMSTR